MEPYQQIFPESNDPTLTLDLPKKSGKIPKGSYRFTESYCADPGCDCRKVVIQVVNEKNKPKAVINFGFDQDSPFGGPYLDMSSDQSPYAADLAAFFADSLNRDSELLDRLYRHYREAREKVEGKPYRGKAFPKPGQLVYQVTPPPDLEAEMLQSLQTLRASGRKAPAPPRTAAAKARPAAPAPPKEERDLPWLVRQYKEAGSGASIDTVMWLRKELRSYFDAQEDAGEELAGLLPELCRQSPQDEDAINAALRLLFDVLIQLGDEMKGNAEAARPRLEKLQKALARQVFEENGDLDLSAAVWNMLVQSRVEIIPVLRQAVTKMMMEGGHRTDLEELAGEEIMSGILRSFESMGVTSPFEAADEMLQLFTLNEPEMQVALLGEMLQAESALLRDMAALMVFNPEPEVRLGVSKLLARGGGSITPETLRRLIISRNWLPEEIRQNVDQTVTRARKSRVECAPLERPRSVTVLASTIDGAGAQSFHVVVPEGSNPSHCGVLVKEALGVGDALLATLKTKGEANALISQLKKEPGIMESTAEFFDLRICHALAEGSAAGNVPGHSLVRIAELLGRDRWRPVSLDPARELLQLWEELQSAAPGLLDDNEYSSALRDSGEWPYAQPFLGSWFEEGGAVGRAVAAARGGKGAQDAVVQRILDDVLEQRRAVWLERLVICALWLKSGDKGPLPWHKMFHVAQAVADETIPLRDIPLMVSIARLTLEAYSATE